MGFLSSVHSVVQGLIFLHQILVTLGLGTIIGIDDHIVIYSLTPDGGSTTGTVVVTCSVASMVGNLLLRIGLVDVTCLVQQSVVEVIVRLPLHGVGDSESLCRQAADTNYCT